MENKKIITSDAVKEMIAETAKYLKKRKQIAERASGLEKELKMIEENFGGLANSFGFGHASDMSNKTKTGFVNTNTPRLTQLGAEIQAEMERVKVEEENQKIMSEDLIDEVKKMKEEIEALKQENKKLKK